MPGISEFPPRFSVIIPARNEQEFISRCISAVERAAGQRSIEKIVVLNRCSDRTEEIARAHGCLIVKEDAKNLSRIRNAGARAARGDFIITVDADSQVSANMFEQIELCMASGRYIGGGVLILPERYSLGIIITALYLLPLALWLGVSGGLFFCRAEDFRAIGGFDESLVSVEDIDFAKRLKLYGKQSRRKFANLFRAHIVTSCRKFDKFGDWYFALRPHLILRLLKGRHQADADAVWYDFPR